VSVFDWKNDKSPSVMAKDLGVRQRVAMNKPRGPSKMPFKPVIVETRITVRGSKKIVDADTTRNSK